MATYTPEPRAYELMVLLSPELGEEGLDSEMNRISEQLASTGTEILRSKATTPWGRRRLAYPIENHQDAFYVLYSLSSQPGDLDPFERELKLNSNVIRYLLIRQEKAEALEDEPEAADATEEAEGAGDAETAETEDAVSEDDSAAADEPTAATAEASDAEPEAEAEESGDEAADESEEDRA